MTKPGELVMPDFLNRPHELRNRITTVNNLASTIELQNSNWEEAQTAFTDPDFAHLNMRLMVDDQVKTFIELCNAAEKIPYEEILRASDLQDQIQANAVKIVARRNDDLRQYEEELLREVEAMAKFSPDYEIYGRALAEQKYLARFAEIYRGKRAQSRFWKEVETELAEFAPALTVINSLFETAGKAWPVPRAQYPEETIKLGSKKNTHDRYLGIFGSPAPVDLLKTFEETPAPPPEVAALFLAPLAAKQVETAGGDDPEALETTIPHALALEGPVFIAPESPPETEQDSSKLDTVKTVGELALAPGDVISPIAFTEPTVSEATADPDSIAELPRPGTKLEQLSQIFLRNQGAIFNVGQLAELTQGDFWAGMDPKRQRNEKLQVNNMFREDTARIQKALDTAGLQLVSGKEKYLAERDGKPVKRTRSVYVALSKENAEPPIIEGITWFTEEK